MGFVGKIEYKSNAYVGDVTPSLVKYNLYEVDA